MEMRQYLVYCVGAEAGGAATAVKAPGQRRSDEESAVGATFHARMRDCVCVRAQRERRGEKIPGRSREDPGKTPERRSQTSRPNQAHTQKEREKERARYLLSLSLSVLAAALAALAPPAPAGEDGTRRFRPA